MSELCSARGPGELSELSVFVAYLQHCLSHSIINQELIHPTLYLLMRFLSVTKKIGTMGVRCPILLVGAATAYTSHSRGLIVNESANHCCRVGYIIFFQ
jgi:hypothetical protein